MEAAVLFPSLFSSQYTSLSLCVHIQHDVEYCLGLGNIASEVHPFKRSSLDTHAGLKDYVALCCC